jgi:hypothetical protein
VCTEVASFCEPLVKVPGRPVFWLPPRGSYSEGVGRVLRAPSKGARAPHFLIASARLILGGRGASFASPWRRYQGVPSFGCLRATHTQRARGEFCEPLAKVPGCPVFWLPPRDSYSGGAGRVFKETEVLAECYRGLAQPGRSGLLRSGGADPLVVAAERAVAFASPSASPLSLPAMVLVVIPRKEASTLRTLCRYFCSSGLRALVLFSTCPDTTSESVLVMAFRADMARNLLSARRTASYSAILLVQGNSSLAA